MHKHVNNPKSFNFWLTLSLSIFFATGYNAKAIAENSNRKASKALYIPLNSWQAIIASLSPELRVINYQHLNVDKPGLQQIMDFAIEGGILNEVVDIDTFADERFAITETEFSSNQTAIP